MEVGDTFIINNCPCIITDRYDEGIGFIRKEPKYSFEIQGVTQRKLNQMLKNEEINKLKKRRIK